MAYMVDITNDRIHDVNGGYKATVTYVYVKNLMVILW
jgi:hypothetical protein